MSNLLWKVGQKLRKGSSQRTGYTLYRVNKLTRLDISLGPLVSFGELGPGMAYMSVDFPEPVELDLSIPFWSSHLTTGHFVCFTNMMSRQ